MSVPGVGSNAAAKIHEHAVTDKEAETYADDDALELERNIKSDEEDKEADDGANDEQDNLEKGTFQPHAHPHIGWGEHNTSPPAHEPTHDGKANGDAKTIHPYGRGGAARRPSGSVADLTAEAAELARAEAASWAQMCPLMAATLGPLSVLLGIPTLTQRWRGQLLDPPVLSSGISNVVELPDPTLSIVLAGVALFCEVAGNGLLILRFSNFHTRITTWVSYAFWIAKIALGIANYIQFALNYPQTQDIIYLEGFWVCPSNLLTSGRCMQYGCHHHHHRLFNLQPRLSPSSK